MSAPASWAISGWSRVRAISLPRPIWLILIALAAGLAAGLDGAALVKAFNSGFGRALGDFALVLLPSFVLAACLSRQKLTGAAGLASAVAPPTAAGMVCPDTAYATLAAVSGPRKLSVAFGTYAGYRLLYPAGPLIVATGVGVADSRLFFVGLMLLLPVWAAGELWARRHAPAAALDARRERITWDTARSLLPLALLAALLAAGALFDPGDVPAAQFLTQPKGALMVAAVVALAAIASEKRREALDGAVSRTASLLFLIGTASAFGTLLMTAVPLARVLPADVHGGAMLLVLFAVTMLFKIFQGSSMATFAVVTPVLAPLVHATNLSPVAAVFAICLGSFAIMPTDSFYWIVRSDALKEHTERSAFAALAGGVALQALAGLAALWCLLATGII